MRDVLFRGKRVDNGETVEGFYIFDGFNHYIVKFYTDENAEGTLYPIQEAFEVVPETVEQFIGQTDKNGKRIFDGDILQKDGSKYRVYYYPTFAMYMLTRLPNGGGSNGMITQIFDCKVIGNIHDNPEMLEATQDGT